MTRRATLPTVPPNRVIREGDVPPRRPPPSPPDSRDPGVDVTSAPRYRIVTNGTVFRVQRRFWLFWFDCEHGPQSYRRWTHRTLADARAHLHELEMKDRRHRGRWAVVR